MNETDKAKLKAAIEDAIQKAIDDDSEILESVQDMYWGVNTVHLAAESAANVLIACAESQKEKEEEEES